MKDLITQVLVYLKEHADSDQTIEETAAYFGYSKYHFSREFKKLTGFSAKEYISAVKMMKSLEKLMAEESTVLDSQLQSGFLSSPTFTRRFKQNTGITPKQYHMQSKQFYRTLKAYEIKNGNSPATFYAKKTKTGCQCTINLTYPDQWQSGTTFVGLFHKPIPNHRPVIGKAISKGRTIHFKNIPDGTYFILACAIAKSYNPLDYFILKNCLRGRVDGQLFFDSTYQTAEYKLSLRPPAPEDPPILINLPLLLKNVLKERNLE